VVDPIPVQLPPLQGCLYCHSEGATSLDAGRKFWRFGSEFPLLKCAHCQSVALLDYQANGQQWRICYQRVNHAPRYYYVALRLGRAGWLSDQQALAISTDGYVQRRRVAQAKAGDLSWLQRLSPAASLPHIHPDETVYLTLKGVTLQVAPLPGLLGRNRQGSVLDSGKLHVTDQALYLAGQRQDWMYPLHDVLKVSYDQRFWAAELAAGDEIHEFQGINAADKWDAQLVATVIETLCNL